MISPTIPFLAAKADTNACTWQIVGLPYDRTSSYRRGAQFGPDELRIASDSIESYSMYRQKDLEDLYYCDVGDLPIANSEPDIAVQTIADFYAQQHSIGKRLFGLGGEHTVTIGALQGLVKAGVKPHILHLDAHFDLRQEYTGGMNSHASVMRRLSDLLGPAKINQWGIRSGERSEFEWAEANSTYLGLDIDSLLGDLYALRDKPVYITLDLDVFDPSEMPGVGNPEPGGLKFSEYLKILPQIQQLDVVGADVVELSPVLDPGGRSPVFAAEVVRELLLTIIH
jgi:agmatinase